MESQTNAGIGPPVDLNTPVENPALVAALARVAAENTDDAKDALLAEIQQANYLAAMLTEGLSRSAGDQPGQVTIEQGSKLGVLCAESEGRNFLVLFSDWAAIKAYTDLKVSGWVLPARDAWALALQGETYDGVVINPAHNALPMERPLLEFLLKHSGPNP